METQNTEGPPLDIGQSPGFFSGLKARFIRNLIAWGFGVAVAHYQNNIWYVSAAPLLQTVGKYLRDKSPGEWEWLPF